MTGMTATIPWVATAVCIANLLRSRALICHLPASVSCKDCRPLVTPLQVSGNISVQSLNDDIQDLSQDAAGLGRSLKLASAQS